MSERRPFFAAWLVAILIASVLLGACKGPLSGSGQAGRLALTVLESGAGGRSILPTNFTPLSYVAVLTRSGYTTISAASALASHTIQDVPAGSWTLLMSAHDGVSGTGKLIGRSAEVPVVISADSVTEVFVTVKPLVTSGATGRLLVSYSWSAARADSATVTLTKYPEGAGVVIAPLPANGANTTGKIDIDANVASGEYKLKLLLAKSGTAFPANEELVQIYDNLTSQKEIAIADQIFSGAPAAPTDLVATIPTSTTVKLTWTDTGSLAMGYNLYRDDALVATIAQATREYTDTVSSLPSGYELRAYNSNCGEGAGASVSVDSVAVERDQTTLAIVYASGDSATSVTKNVGVAATGAHGTGIAWSSDKILVVAANGVVARPAQGTGDAVVVLTATVTKGAATKTKTFSLMVKENVFQGGTGSAEDPYLISNYTQLYNVRNYLDKYAYFRQVADVYIASNPSWEPIARNDGNTYTQVFYGHYDGGGRSIYGLSYASAALDYRHLGLFGVVGGTSTLKNITIRNPVLSGNNYVGGLAGSFGGVSIDNCKVIGGSMSGTNRYVAGLLGQAGSGTITNCSASASVSSAMGWSGGLIGWANNPNVNGCSSTGSVTIGTDGGDSGGLIGCVFGNVGQSFVKNSFATGKVEYSGTNVNRGDDMGGLVGAASETYFENCYATGDVSGIRDVGGLVGQLVGYALLKEYCYIIGSHADGKISGTTNTGGLVGFSDFVFVKDSWATGAVTGTGTGENIGGLFGFFGFSYSGGSGIVFPDGYTIVVNNTYSSGAVTGTTKVGGIAGMESFSNIGSGKTAMSKGESRGVITGNFYVGGITGKGTIKTQHSEMTMKGTVVLSGTTYTDKLYGD